MHGDEPRYDKTPQRACRPPEHAAKAGGGWGEDGRHTKTAMRAHTHPKKKKNQHIRCVHEPRWICPRGLARQSARRRVGCCRGSCAGCSTCLHGRWVVYRTMRAAPWSWLLLAFYFYFLPLAIVILRRGRGGGGHLFAPPYSICRGWWAKQYTYRVREMERRSVRADARHA